MDFIAIDVETANPDLASICQIGVVKFVGGDISEEWSSLIDPQDFFDEMNMSIHGITPKDVEGAPTFPDVTKKLTAFLETSISVCHTHFDRVSLKRACDKYRIQEIETIWLDSAMVARRAWDDCAHQGYGLSDLSQKIGYRFKSHDALEDAKACGQVLLAAIEKSGLNTKQWLYRVRQPIDLARSSRGSAIKRDGNPEGALYGEEVVFTGSLQLPRYQAANLAANIGCSVGQGVTKKTTILVVGNQDITRLGGKEKSTKHIKAEGLIDKGQIIRILKEDDFLELVGASQQLHFAI